MFFLQFGPPPVRKFGEKPNKEICQFNWCCYNIFLLWDHYLRWQTEAVIYKIHSDLSEQGGWWCTSAWIGCVFLVFCDFQFGFWLPGHTAVDFPSKWRTNALPESACTFMSANRILLHHLSLSVIDFIALVALHSWHTRVRNVDSILTWHNQISHKLGAYPGFSNRNKLQVQTQTIYSLTRMLLHIDFSFLQLIQYHIFSFLSLFCNNCMYF